jgi:hypothetical protein
MSDAAGILSAQYSTAERQVVQGIRGALRAEHRAILLIDQDSGSVRIPDAALIGCTSADRLLRIGPPLPQPPELKEVIASAAGIVAAGGISPKGMARLLLISDPKQPVVLAIDDADRLPRESLFFLAQLSDSVASLSASMAKEGPALQIVLAARTALREILSQPDFRSFQSRITLVGELPETLPVRLGPRAIAPQAVRLVPAPPAPRRLGHLVGGVVHTAPGAYGAAAAFAVGGLVLALLAFVYGPALLPGRSVNSGAPRELPAAAGRSPTATPLGVQETDKAITTLMPDYFLKSDQVGRASSFPGAGESEAAHVGSVGGPPQNEDIPVVPGLPPIRSATPEDQLDAADQSALSSNVVVPPAPSSAPRQLADGRRPARVARVAPTTPKSPTAQLSGREMVANPINEANSLKKAKPVHDANTLGIVTPDGDDTEFAVAEDVAALIATGQETGPHGEVVLGVVPILGDGGVQNIRDVLTLADADMSIVPVPLLDRATVTLGLEALRRHIVYITPLFEEEFHLLASRSILNISDLAGKTVNFGMKNGAADVLGHEIFARLGINVNAVNLNQNDAINAMSKGQVDADLVLSGKPVRSLASYTLADGFHFIAVPRSPYLEKEFLPATLTHDDYPNLIPAGLSAAGSVDTIGVDSVLIAYNWPKNGDRYRLLDLFVRTLFSRFSELQSGPHHPKLREVNLAASLAGWRQFPPAQRWLDRKEFESFLSKRGIDAAADRGRLRQDFLHLR